MLQTELFSQSVTFSVLGAPDVQTEAASNVPIATSELKVDVSRSVCRGLRTSPLRSRLHAL